MKPKPMKQSDLEQLSRDYVLAHKEFTVLSFDYVIEHGREWDWEGDIGWDGDGYRVCDLSGEEEVPVTGLLYGLYPDGNLSWYVFYEDGLETGSTVYFFPSGEIRSCGGYEWYETGQIRKYYVVHESTGISESYEWYENGKVKQYVSRCKGFYPYRRIDYDEQGNITKEILGG